MKQKSYSLFLWIFLIFVSGASFGATYYSRINGNWNTASTWSIISCSGVATSSVPGAGDNVIICSGRTVTMNGAPGSCLSLTISGTANWTSASAVTNVGAGGLTINNGGSIAGSATGTLNVAGPFTIPSGATATLGGVNLAVTGLTSINGIFGDNSTGGANTFANINLNAGGVFNNSSVETYTVTGNLNTYGGDFAGSQTATFNIGGDFNVVSGVCDMSRLNITVAGNTLISGTLNVNNVRGAKNFNNLTVAPGGSFNVTVAESFRISGNILVNGTFNANNGIFTLTGAGKTIGGSTAMTFDDLTVNGSYTNTGNVRIVTSFRGSGSWTQGSGSTVDIGMNNGNLAIATFNASAAGNTVVYSRAGGMTVLVPSDGSYSNLTVSNIGNKTLPSATICSGNVLINTLATLDAGTGNLSVGGNFTNNGTFSNSGAQTVIMNGTAAQTIGGTTTTTFRNLNITNSSAIVTGAANFTVSALFTVGAGAIFSPNPLNTVGGAGTLTGNGTVRVTRVLAVPDFVTQYTITGKTLAGLNVDYIGAGNQNVNALMYGSLTISTNGTRTVTFPAAIAGVSNVFSPTTITTGYVVTGNTIDFNGSVTQTIPVFNYNHLTSSLTGARILSPSGTIGVAGVFTPGTNSYTIAGSTINYNGTVAQNVAAFNYFHLASSSTGARTLAPAGTIGVAGTFTPGTNSYTVTGSTVNYNGSGAQSVAGFTYHHFVTSGAGSKTLTGNITTNGNLTITSDLDVSASNFSINTKGNWTKNGTFNARNGTVMFSGTSAQTIFGAGLTSFYGLDMNNTGGGVSLTGGTYELVSVINPVSGNFNANGFGFTMLSTAGTTARIGQLGAGASLSGNFTVQRYITARDTSYADLCAPVQATDFADWDNELPALSYINNPPVDLPSAYTYDESGDVYVPVTSASTALVPGKGYEVFLAGDYFYASLPNTTMDAIGVPNQGSYNLSGLISNNVQGWNLVGNPFASSISWASVYAASGSASSGLYDFIEMYDYTIGDWAGYTSADAIEVGSAQGFWVYGLPGATSLTLQINESAKTTTSNSTIKAPKTDDHFSLKLGRKGSTISHTFLLRTSPLASDGLDNADIPFHLSPNRSTPQLYCVVDGRKINRDVLSGSKENYSIRLETRAGVSGSYRFEAAGLDVLNDYSCVTLEDKLKGHFIDLRESSFYEATLTQNENPFRFVLHLSRNGNCDMLASSAGKNNDGKVEVLSSASGNQINFSYSEMKPVTISVTNVLGQDIIPSLQRIVAFSTEEIILPSGYSGIYFVRIISDEEVIVKEFMRK